MPRLIAAISDQLSELFPLIAPQSGSVFLHILVARKYSCIAIQIPLHFERKYSTLHSTFLCAFSSK